MFEKGGHSRSKREISVTMSLAGDEIFDATLFILHGERLIDLLNDDRGFIPVKRADGATIIVAKSNIVSVVERSEASESPEARAEEDVATDPEEPPAKPASDNRKRDFDPYKTLRIDPAASDEDVRRAYKSRMKAVHPDTLAGLDLDDEIARAAKLASQRVNYAYQRIMKERSEASANSSAA